MAVVVYPTCNSIVAHLPGVVNAVHDAAQDGARGATSILRAHFHEGRSRIEVTRGSVDSWVSLVDPAAVSIEFGRTGARGRGSSQGVFAVTGGFGIVKGGWGRR
jgi:hypothetical protein